MEQIKVIASHYYHIDNGGISVSIEDRYEESGVFLVMSGEYFGYPAIKMELQLGNKARFLNSKWLKEVGMMFISAADKI